MKIKTNRCYRFFILLGIGSLFYACSPSITPMETQDHHYFDIKGFFESEIRQLKAKNPEVLKEVSVDGEREIKTLKIKDWDKELQSFISSDINKPAWKTMYRIDSTTQGVTYTALDSTYKTLSIQIAWDQAKHPISLQIHNRNQNMLYKSEEWLKYEPEAQYEILKSQEIRWISSKRFEIKTIFQ
jgi:hypothetical protein